jgi:DNA polymerase-4
MTVMQASLDSSSRTIVHLDLDSFFVSVSILHRPALRGHPVLVGGSSDRGVVAACSYEARKYGIHSAMPIKTAKRLCPEAIIIRGDYEEYGKFSEMVTEIIREKVPLYEKSSIDEFYVDLTGMDRFFGCYKFASELRQKIIRETHLPISLGFSKNKTVSKVATGEAKPNGQLKIDYGDEKNFLAPLSIKKIPMIGDKTYHLLRNMGVEKVHTLQQMPVEMLELVLGENGNTIWKKANGIDNSPVIPYHERKSISSEETFDTDTIDMVKLKSVLVTMTEKLAYQLRVENKLTACVSVKIRYSDFDTHSMQSRISHSSCDHTLLSKVKELFGKLYNRRQLIRLIGVRFSHLAGGGHQINLFEDSHEIIQLYQAMDIIRKKFGHDKIHRALGEGYSMKEFNPFNGIKKI